MKPSQKIELITLAVAAFFVGTVLLSVAVAIQENSPILGCSMFVGLVFFATIAVRTLK